MKHFSPAAAVYRKPLRIPKVSLTKQPPIEHFWDSRNSVWYRMMWAMVFIACSATCFYQVCERFSYYSSDPISTDIELVWNETVKFPSVTICPITEGYSHLEPFKVELNKILQLKSACHITAFQLLDNGVLNYSDIWNYTDMTNFDVSGRMVSVSVHDDSADMKYRFNLYSQLVPIKAVSVLRLSAKQAHQSLEYLVTTTPVLQPLTCDANKVNDTEQAKFALMLFIQRLTGTRVGISASNVFMINKTFLLTVIKRHLNFVPQPIPRSLTEI